MHLPRVLLIQVITSHALACFDLYFIISLDGLPSGASWMQSSVGTSCCASMLTWAHALRFGCCRTYAELKRLTYTRIRRRRRRKPPDPRRRLTGKMKRVMKTARFFYEDCADYIRAWTSQLVSRLHLALRRSVELAWICRLCIVVRVLNSTPLGLGIICGKG